MNKCEVCGTEKRMHYKLFCPKCYVPESIDIKAYDFFKMLYHMDYKYDGFKNRFWREFIIDNYDIKNDSFFRFDFYYYGDEQEEEKYISEEEYIEQIEDLRLFRKEYVHLLENDKQQSIWLWVSW